MAEFNEDSERGAAWLNSMETARRRPLSQSIETSKGRPHGQIQWRQRGGAEFNTDLKREAAWPSSMETPRGKPRLDKRTAKSKTVQAS
jgi:hypothetical protein